MIKYIADREHYTEVLSRCEKVKHDLWIGTADLKDLYVGSGKNIVPFLSILDKLLKRGVEVRLLYAKEPGENFRADFDKYPGLWTKLERRLCPRVHFKIMIFDCATAYIGSANLTGAGIGMKGRATVISRRASLPTSRRWWMPLPTTSTACGRVPIAPSARGRTSAVTGFQNNSTL